MRTDKVRLEPTVRIRIEMKDENLRKQAREAGDARKLSVQLKSI